jgi:peptidoglycan/xylan/chitin deacetylase (PgdA/CDA1 family)
VTAGDARDGHGRGQREAQQPRDLEPRPIARRVVLAAAGGVLLSATAAAIAVENLGSRQHPAAGTELAHPRTAPGTAQTRPAVGPASSSRASSSPASSRPEPPRNPAHPGTGGESRPKHPRLPYEKPVYYIDDGPKVIALTIDDGPSPVYTPQILRILQQYGITASFSMVGQNVAEYPAVAREVAAAGHMIINHTWNHHNLSRMTASAVQEEISRATDTIGTATGKYPAMFRAPYGFWSPTVFRCCANDGLTPLAWSVDPRDWARPGSRAIVRTVLSTTHTGSIILEHDGGGNRSQTVAALRIWLPRLLDAGFRFTTP